MAWEEWEQLKARAAERGGARLQSDQLPAGRGGSTGDLVSDRPAWNRAGEDIGALREDIGKAVARLRDSQAGLGGGTGCLTAAAQKDVHSSWEAYVGKVGGRCGKLSDLLVKAGSEQLKTDQAVEAEIAKLVVAYADTPPVGGRYMGR
ncbi:hypothetical protein ABZ023_01900 [Streptomyces sp. NPDC006367]|uniref:hypothetical protein n=1 Tax=unclassified Streptomyces TaxID=2593676 RepID=UPI0033A5C2BD